VRNFNDDVPCFTWLNAYDLERLQLSRWLASVGGIADVDLGNCFAASGTNVSDSEGDADCSLGQLSTQMIKVEQCVAQSMAERVRRLNAPRLRPAVSNEQIL
jgi:hypothetical protein